MTVRTFGPLGLGARQRTTPVPGVVRSLPPFRSRRHLPAKLAQLRQLDGRSAVRTRGQGTEFDSLRDYVEGDDVRSIDWRATARRQHVVVRTWQPERDRRVILVLDTARTSAARIGDEPRLDAAMDAALLLAALASRAGDRVDLVAGDRSIRARVGSGTTAGRSGLLHQLVTAMAPLEPVLLEADWPLLAGAVTSLTRRRALVVLLTPLEPAALEEGLLPVLPGLTAHHRVVVASVADPALEDIRTGTDRVEQTYAAAAAERTESLRHRTAVALNQLGVTVLDESPEDLPVWPCPTTTWRSRPRACSDPPAPPTGRTVCVDRRHRRGLPVTDCLVLRLGYVSGQDEVGAEAACSSSPTSPSAPAAPPAGRA